VEDGAGWDNDTVILTTGEKWNAALLGLVKMLGRTMWPSGLRPHYRILLSDIEASSPSMLLSYSCLIAVVVLSIVEWRTTPGLAATTVGVLAWIAPVCGIVQHGSVQMGADRYMYLTSLALVPMLAGLIALGVGEEKSLLEVVKRDTKTFEKVCTDESAGTDTAQSYLSPVARAKLSSIRRGRFLYRFVGACSAAFIFSQITARQAQIWRSDESLHTHGLNEDHADWRIIDMVIDELIKTGNTEKALPMIPVALEHAPRRGVKAFMLRAKLTYFQSQAKGEGMEATCDFYSRGMHKFSKLTPAMHSNIGLCHLVDAAKLRPGHKSAPKKVADAIAHFREGLRLKSKRPRYVANLQSNLENALRWYEHPQRDQMSYAGGHNMIF
jgi:hypothetical protein